MNDDAKFKVFFWLGTATSLCFIVYLLRGMMAPFVIAGLLAYLADPLADKLEARGLSRTLAVIIIFSFFSFFDYCSFAFFNSFIGRSNGFFITITADHYRMVLSANAPVFTEFNWPK